MESLTFCSLKDLWGGLSVTAKIHEVEANYNILGVGSIENQSESLLHARKVPFYSTIFPALNPYGLNCTSFYESHWNVNHPPVQWFHTVVTTCPSLSRYLSDHTKVMQNHSTHSLGLSCCKYWLEVLGQIYWGQREVIVQAIRRVSWLLI